MAQQPKGVLVELVYPDGDQPDPDVRVDFVGKSIEEAVKILEKEQEAEAKQPITLNGRKVERDDQHKLEDGDTLSVDPYR